MAISVGRRSRRGDVLTHAALTLWILFVLWPLYWVFTMALKHESEVLARPPKIFGFEPTLDNYATVLNLAVSGLALWYIVVPLVAPGMVASGILVFIYMWNNFVFGLLLGGTEIQPVTVGILNYLGYDQLQYTRMAAASVICITPEIIAGMFIQRYILKGLSSGAVKG